MEINITYKSPEHEAAFLSELQRMEKVFSEWMCALSLLLSTL